MSPPPRRYYDEFRALCWKIRVIREACGLPFQEKPLHRLTLGDCELIILSDGTYELDGGAMFGVVPKTLWEKRIKADERNLITLGLNSLLIRDGKHTVLVETGIGPKLNEKSREIPPEPGGC